MNKVIKHSENIRKFVLKHLIRDRLNTNMNGEKTPNDDDDDDDGDFLDCLLNNVRKSENKKKMEDGGEGGDGGEDGSIDMETALFSLEDIIGGHSAVGNFLVKLLTFLVDNKTVQDNIKKEIDRREKDFISLDDRQYMPYTESVIMEGLRMLSSPIVPHVSNQDTTIAGKANKHANKQTNDFHSFFGFGPSTCLPLAPFHNSMSINFFMIVCLCVRVRLLVIRT